MLVNQAKQTQSQPVQPPTPVYGYNQYSQPPQNIFPPAQPAQPDLSNVLASLNPNALAQLLGAMSSQPVAPQPAPAPVPVSAGLNVDIARLLAQVSQPPTQQSQQSQAPSYGASILAQHAQQPFTSQFPGMAGLLAGQGQVAQAPPPQQQQQQQQQVAPSSNVDMSEIMAQLQKYQR